MKLGFIGVGKISCSLVEAFCTATIDDLTIYLSPRSEDNATRLSSTFSAVKKMSSNQEVLQAADIIFLAVRPHEAREIISPLTFHPRHQVVSLVAFLQHSDLSDLVAPAANACRAIPLPSVVNHVCPIPLYHGNEAVKALLTYIGQPLVMQTEDQLHKIWTLTGFISPFYDMMGTLSQWAVDQGVDAKTANTYVADMFQSLVTVAQKADPMDFAALSRHAATAKGLNEQAGREIKAKGAHAAYSESAENIYRRIKEGLTEG